MAAAAERALRKTKTILRVSTDIDVLRNPDFGQQYNATDT